MEGLFGGEAAVGAGADEDGVLEGGQGGGEDFWGLGWEEAGWVEGERGERGWWR